MDVQNRIIEILAEQAVLDPSEITPDQSLEEIGIDSMGVVESIFAMEESFDIEIPFNANNPDAGDFDLSSVTAIVKAVKGLIAEQHS